MVSVIALLVLVSIVTLIAIMTLKVADTGVNDSLNQRDSVAALFLAESGLEYATQQLSSGVTCGGVVGATQSFGRGNFTISNAWASDFNGATLTGQCRVEVSGTVSNSDVTRTVQGIINYSGGITLASNSSITRNNDNSIAFPITVAGSNQLLVVSVALMGDSADSIKVSSVTYAGTVALANIGAIKHPSPNNVRVEMWQAVGPLTTGSNTIQITLAGGKTAVVAGAILLTGVDQTAPIEASDFTQCGTASSTTNVSLSSLTGSAWVIDVLGALKSTPVPVAGSGQTEVWNAFTGGAPSSRVRGATSTYGPLSSSPATMSWDFAGISRSWCLGAAAIKPASGAGVGVLSWREIIS